jgi:hypothetical protein
MSTVFGGLGVQQVKVWKAITQDTYQLAKFVLGRGCLSFFVKNIPWTPLIPYIPHLGRGCLRKIPYESPLPRLWWLRWRVIRVNAQAMLGTPRGCLGVRVRKSSPDSWNIMEYSHWIRLYLLLGGLEHGFNFSIYWEFHHPNWRAHIFQRGRYTTNQSLDIYVYGL